MRVFVIILFFILQLNSCMPNKGDITIDINDSLKTLISNKDYVDKSVNICNFIEFSDWDSLAVIKPYTDIETLRKKKIKNFTSLEGSIAKISDSDFTCLLIFLKDESIAKIAWVSRNPDFATLHGQIPIIKKETCDLILRNNNDYFFFEFSVKRYNK
jgi:hypothetical protein